MITLYDLPMVITSFMAGLGVGCIIGLRDYIRIKGELNSRLNKLEEMLDKEKDKQRS